MPSNDESRIEFLQREEQRIVEAIAALRALLEQSLTERDPVMERIRQLQVDVTQYEYLHHELGRTVAAIDVLSELVEKSFAGDDEVLKNVRELRVAARRLSSAS